MKHYEDLRYTENKEYFTKKYKEFLKQPKKGWGPYKDPDSYYDCKGMFAQFYEDLTDFMSARISILCSTKKIDFTSPKGDKLPDYVTIKLDIVNKTLFLTSDQFGFSAPKYDSRGWRYAYWQGTYPYDKLLICGKCKGQIYDLVTECVYETRTLGGSFIWPKVQYGSSWKSLYNMNRGVSSYIEDRVDLTLYEIKCFYAVYKKQKPNVDFGAFYKEYEKYYPKNILMKKNNSESKALFKWLSLFGTFEKYVEFFCFDDFVDENYIPWNITERLDVEKQEGKPLEIEKSNENGLPLLSDYEFRLNDLKIEQLEQTVENVKNLVVKRSETMQKKINEYLNAKANS